MILDEVNLKELGKSYEQSGNRTKVHVRCDYCGIEFMREKRQIAVSNKIINKDSCGSKSCTKKKKEEGSIKLYGSPNYFTSNSFVEKSKAKNLKKYGSEKYFSSKDFFQKRKKSLLEKYGVESPLQCDEIKEKQKNTCLKIYGNKNFAKTDLHLEKIKKKSIEKYGCEYPMQSNEVKKKRDETCQKKYGKKNFVQTEEYWSQRINTCLEKYGVEHPHQNESIRKKMVETLIEKYGVDCFSKHESFKKKYQETCMERYGVKSPLCLPENRPNLKQQNEIRDWLNSFGHNFNNDFSVLENRELDIYDKDQNLAIEFCGIFWHAEDSFSPKTRSYHHDKWKKCRDKGIQLLTIFDDEWNAKSEICKSIILSKLGIFENRIQARKCKIKKIEKSQMKSFCDLNHLQGANKLSEACFGLFHEEELVGVVDLGRHHRKKNTDSVVLTRLCFKTGLQIVGGSGKLFKACVEWCRSNGMKKIISWSDNRYSDGSVYEKLGFKKAGELPPDYCYVNMKNPKRRFSKQSQSKKQSKCPASMTELQWAISRGLSRIWDCGKARWEFEISE
jgi:hypothetical protein